MITGATLCLPAAWAAAMFVLHATALAVPLLLPFTLSPTPHHPCLTPP